MDRHELSDVAFLIECLTKHGNRKYIIKLAKKHGMSDKVIQAALEYVDNPPKS